MCSVCRRPDRHDGQPGLACARAQRDQTQSADQEQQLFALLFSDQAVKLASFNNIPHLDRPDRLDAVSYG